MDNWRDELAPSGTLVFNSQMAGDAQDLADGAALRRLREALPDDANDIEVDWYRGRPEAWFVRVEDPHDGGSSRAIGWGDTVAEAADKCREALG